MPDFEPLPRTEPDVLSGYRAPEDQIEARVVVDMSDTILRYMPDAQPFLTVTGRIKGKRRAHNLKFEWMEKDFQPRRVQVSGAQSDVDTALELVAGDGSKVAKNALLKNTRTGEIVLADSISTDTVTAVRAIGGAGVAMNDGDYLIIIGNSFPDNSLMGDMKSIAEYPNFNYTQIFRRPFGFSGRDIATELYGGSDEMNETKWQAVEHKRDIEYAFLFGKRHLIPATATVKQRTMTGGLEASIQTNVWNVAGVTLNERTFTEFLEEGLRWGKGGRLQGGKALKYLFMSSRWGTEINSWVGDRLQYDTLDDEIGFSAASFLSPHGRVRFVPTPILDEFHPDYAFLVDVNHVDYVTLRGRDTKLLRDREENDRDGKAYEYFSDVGLLVEFEQSHALLKGINV